MPAGPALTAAQRPGLFESLATRYRDLLVTLAGINDIRYLNIPVVIAPTWTDPTTGARRGWFVKAGGYEKPFPTWAVFLMIVPAIGGTLLGFLDQNLTEVLINRKDRMLKKLPAYHLCATPQRLWPACRPPVVAQQSSFQPHARLLRVCALAHAGKRQLRAL